jgi:hypothetical protein
MVSINIIYTIIIIVIIIAIRALTNITSTDRTHIVVEYGAVPHLSVLLTSANPNIREQSAWCLGLNHNYDQNRISLLSSITGNIAGDGPSLRDVVLNAGNIIVIPNLITIIITIIIIIITITRCSTSSCCLY